ncbi:hypothetical protein Avbf_00181 [Armadillidium vulgare]|nr:hypothetical protein Avbf_00181 [Armadillidium vulgare]
MEPSQKVLIFHLMRLKMPSL